MTETEFLAEIERLKSAIRLHRDQQGDDRCWLDDLALYESLGEPFEPKALALHCPAEMLENCRRYIASRQPNGVPYVSPQRTIEQLKIALEDAYRMASGVLSKGQKDFPQFCGRTKGERLQGIAELLRSLGSDV